MNKQFAPDKLKLIKIGNSVGVVIPSEDLRRLGLVLGGEVSVTRRPNGIELSSGDEEFETQMAVARDVMLKRRAALRELAK